MLLAMILGLGLAEAQEAGDSGEGESTQTSEDSESSDSAVKEATEEATKIVDKKTELLGKEIIEKSLAKPIIGDEILEDLEKDSEETLEEDLKVEEGEEVDGVIGAVEDIGGLTWDNLTETKEEFGVIFRPQFGFSSLQTADNSYSGLHAGLNVGHRKYHRLRLSNVGIYSRHRTLFLPILGELSGSEIRVGSVLGMKISALEAEAGFDFIRHSLKVRGADIDYGPSYGVATPVQVLLNFDSFKLKAKIEPRWYAGNSRESVDWTEHRELTTLPIEALGDEFTWAIGARMGWFGLSYDQLHMDQGIQRTISFGLQR